MKQTCYWYMLKLQSVKLTSTIHDLSNKVVNKAPKYTKSCVYLHSYKNFQNMCSSWKLQINLKPNLTAKQQYAEESIIGTRLQLKRTVYWQCVFYIVISHGDHVVISYHHFSMWSPCDDITSPLLHETTVWWDHITTFPHGQHMVISGCVYWVEIAWVHLFTTSWDISKRQK